MIYIKLFSTSFLAIFVIMPVLSQKVDLNWKVKTDEPIAYKTINETLKNENSGIFEGLIKMMSDTSSTTIDSAKTMNSKYEKFVEAMYGDTKSLEQLSILTKRTDGMIDVKFVLDDFSESNENDSSNTKLFQRMARGVQLRGIINPSGKIESFYTKVDQKNLLSLLFELPTKKVKKGDEWSLSVNWIQMNHQFIADSSYRVNKASLIQLKKENGNQIAVINYNLKEGVFGSLKNPMNQKNVPTTMQMGFEGVAEFSITDGKLINFNGVLSYDATGFQTSSTKQAYILSEITVIPDKLKSYE